MAVTSATVRRSQPRAHSASRGPGERGSPYLGEQSVAWPDVVLTELGSWRCHRAGVPLLPGHDRVAGYIGAN